MRLLELPLWKWCAIVEGWIWSNTEEKDTATVQRALESPVDFTWIAASIGSGADELKDPLRWQTNRVGESLLSVHRKRQTDGSG